MRSLTDGTLPLGQTGDVVDPTRVHVSGRELTLTNLDKVLYPAAGVSKADVIEYYARVAPVMVPHLAGRPVTLVRWPNGVDADRFFEKRCPPHAPAWVTKGGPQNNCIVDSAATLVWTANLAALELHPLRARVDDPDRPTDCVIDLDPGPPADVRDCCRIALVLRDLLGDLGLQVLAKTSGGKGLHLSIPLNTAATHERTKRFARALGLLLAERDHEVLVEMDKDKRTGKVFLDWSQNDRNKTTIAPYSLRGRARPTVSTPITWDEVEAGVDGRARLVFEAADVLARVDDRGDLWAAANTLEQALPDL